MAGKAQKAGGARSQTNSKRKKKKSLSRAPGQPVTEDQLPLDAEPSEQESNEPQPSSIEETESAGADANESDTAIDSAPAFSEIAQPESSVQESVQEPAFTREKAVDVVERFFTVLIMAHISPQVVLRPANAIDGQPLTIEQFEQSMRETGLEQFELVPTEIRALRVFQNEQGRGLDIKALCDQANAITFRVEMCEFQLRSAVCTDKTSSGKPTRGKLDVQRVVRRLLANIPAESDDNAGSITSKQFEVLLATKLAVTPGSFLTKIMFARIIRRPFQRNFPRMLEASRDTFCESLELFCTETPLSMDCVEGQLRALVTRHPDLRRAFQDLDTDASGSISSQEFITFLQREAQLQVPEDTLGDFLKRFDVDGDGSLSYEEFAEFAHPKQFGIQVLSPFGLFYLGVNRLESMRNVVDKIKTRLFWLQHNDLLAGAPSSSSTSAARTPTLPSYPNSQPTATSGRQPRLKLKVTKQFILTHHFGTLRLQYKPSDRVCSVLSNGEMVVLLMVSDNSPEDTAANSNNVRRTELSLPFEYRLKLTSKRRIPALFSSTQTMAQQEQQLQLASSSATKPKNPHVRRLRAPSILSSAASSSSRISLRSDERPEQAEALSLDQRSENESEWSESQHTPERQSLMQSAMQPTDSPLSPAAAAPAAASATDVERLPSPLESDGFEVFEDSGPEEEVDDEQIAADADDAGDEMIAPLAGEPEYPAEEEELPPPYE